MQSSIPSTQRPMYAVRQARQPEHRPRLLRGAEALHLNQDLLRARLPAHALPGVPMRIGMW